MTECERCGHELPTDSAIYTLRGYDFCRACFEADQREEAELADEAARNRADDMRKERKL